LNFHKSKGKEVRNWSKVIVESVGENYLWSPAPITITKRRLVKEVVVNFVSGFTHHKTRFTNHEKEEEKR